MKTVEFIVYKLHDVIFDKFHHSTIHQTLRLIKVFVIKTSENSSILTPNQLEQFTIFNYKVFNLLMSTYFFQNRDKEVLNEENTITLISFMKAIVSTLFIDADHKHFNTLNFASLCLKICVQSGTKVKERIFGLIIQLVNKYIANVRQEDSHILPYKIFLAFIISHSTQDAIYALSSLNTVSLYETIYIDTDIKDTTDEALKKFYNDIIRESKDHPYDIHKYFGQKDKKQDLIDTISSLLTHVHDHLSKIEINFIFKLLNSDYIDDKTKLGLFKNIFSSKTKDVQDLFDGLYRYVHAEKATNLFKDQAFLVNFSCFLIESLHTKSVSKTILKTIFLLFKMEFDHVVNQNADLVYPTKNLLSILIKTSINESHKNEKSEKNEKSIVLHREDNDSHTNTKQLTENNNKNPTLAPKNDLKEREDSEVALTNSYFCDFKQLFEFLHLKVNEINEIKTHGLFFLLLIDFYEMIKKKSKMNFEHIFDENIAIEYLGKTSGSIVLDSFLLKSFLVNDQILESMHSPKIVETLYNYLLSKDSKLNIKNIQEFSNNYIKNRNEILKFVFEVKSLFLRHLLAHPEYHSYLQGYVADLADYLNEFREFLRASCDCAFIDFEETTAKAIKKIHVVVREDSYKGLNDSIDILNKGEIKS